VAEGNPIVVVGIGVDGWPGLSPVARDALTQAEVIIGDARQLELIPPGLAAQLRVWPSPLLPALPALMAEREKSDIAILASGDPMYYGIGGTLARRYGADSVRVLPQVSSVSLACARLAWPLEEVEVYSMVGRPVAALRVALQPARRLLVLLGSADATTEICRLLCASGFGASEITVLSQLGGPAESVQRTSAELWGTASHDRVAVLAIELRLADDRVPIPRVGGLPDELFDSDGQITKSEIRALTIASLAPIDGQLLWDVGAGSGSVGIEWMRSHRACRTIAVEPRPDRVARIRDNAETLGVPGLQVISGRAPDALSGLPAPDAIFVGGAVSVAGVIEACHAALRPGGRLVANGVTLETETVLARWHAEHGGNLIRVAVQRAAPIGGFTGWRPAMPVTQWTYRKPWLTDGASQPAERNAGQTG
jgi:precorrin-6Y C5,15-methyltransferase (decarboxylating)